MKKHCSIFLSVTLSIAALFLCSRPLPGIDDMYALEYGTIEQKIEAMRHLGRSGNKSGFWYFVKYLDFSPSDQDSPRTIACRAAAAEALGRIQDDRAVKFLIKRWEKEENSLVKEKIMFSFKYYRNEDIIPKISEGLSSSENTLVFQSLITAAHHRNSSLTGPVSQIFGSTDDSLLKAASAFALYRTTEEHDEYQQYLGESLSSSSPWQRYWSVHFIGKARIIPLLPEVQKTLEIENTVWVRKEAEKTVAILHNEIARKKRLREENSYEHILN